MFRVDNEKCLRCGMCTGIEPDVFEFNDEGDIKVNNDKINSKNRDQVLDAMNSCPAEAIQMVMDDTPIREGLKEIEKEDN